MKKTLIILSFLFMVASCSFLDTGAPGIVDRERMFADEQGFEDALTGVYSSLASPALYGKELSFGFVDEIAQLYYNDYEKNETPLTKTYDLRYTDTDVRRRIDKIWEEAYHSIASLNSLLEHAENAPFPRIPQIKGEALTLRAFIHFDLLRLFAPVTGRDSEKTIPYVTLFSNTPQPRLTMSQFYARIIDDLQKACDLLEISMPHSRVYVSKDVAEAMLARVFLWKGDFANAERYARAIVEKDYSLAREEQMKNLFMGYSARSECLWVLHAPKMYLDVKQILYPALRTNKMNMVRSNYKQIFQVGKFTPTNNDYRFQAYFTQTDWGKTVVTLTKLYDKNYDETQKFQEGRVPGVNMVRLPEMYYILAEVLYPDRKEEALKALNTVITARGLKPLTYNDIASPERFKQVLMNEIIKEYWGEGQIFFAYKRMQLPMEGLNGKIHPATGTTYVLPLPEDEQKEEI